MPRPWLVGLVQALYDRGLHPEGVTVRTTRWGPDRVEGTVVDDQGQPITFVFESVDDPRRLDLDGGFWTARVDLVRGRVEADARHRLGRGRVTAQVERMAADPWTTTVAVDLRPRHWLLVLAPLLRWWARGQVVKALDETARDWNDAVAEAVRRPPHESIPW